jgi:O-antigen ligase
LLQTIFYLAIALVPIIQFSIAGTFGIADILFIFIAFTLFISKVNSKQSLSVNSYYIFLIIILAASATLSLINASDIVDGVVKTAQLLFVFLIFIPVIVSMLNTSEKIKRTLDVLIVIGSLSVIYAVLPDYLNINIETKTIHGRYYSFFNNPWIFSLYLTIILPYMVSFFLYEKNKVYYAISILINVFGILLSGGRTSFLCLLILLIIYIFVYIRKKIRSVKLLASLQVFILLLAFIVIISLNSILVFFVTLFQNSVPALSVKLSTLLEDEVDLARTHLYEVGLDYLQKSPIIGSGLGEFENISGTVSMHSYFPSLWIETGLFGLLSILILHAYCLYLSYKFKDRIQKSVWSAVVLSHVILLIFMLVNPLLLYRLFWIPLAVNLAFVNFSTK